MLQISMCVHSEKIQNPREKVQHQSSANENPFLKGDAERGTKGEKRRVLQYDHALGRSHNFGAEELSQSGLSRVGLEIRPKRASTEQLQVQSSVALGWPGAVLTVHLFEICLSNSLRLDLLGRQLLDLVEAIALRIAQQDAPDEVRHGAKAIPDGEPDAFLHRVAVIQCLITNGIHRLHPQVVLHAVLDPLLPEPLTGLLQDQLQTQLFAR